MPNEPNYLSDEERLAALRRIQRRMRIPKDIDTREIVAHAIAQAAQLSELMIPLLDNLVAVSHSQEPRKVQRTLRKSLRDTTQVKDHINKGCTQCRKLASRIVREMQKLTN